MTGTAYCLYDNVNSNKIHIVEKESNPLSNVQVINLEFEENAKSENLEKNNQDLVGKDVVRIAIYIEDVIYYVEQEITISALISNHIQYISEEENSPVLERIISNSTWYTYLDNTKPLLETDLHSTASTWSRPILSDELSATDISTITKIGRMNFIKEQFVCYWDNLNADYGYMIDCVEWPTDSGNILVSCLYYDIIINEPGSVIGDDTALQLTLITNRQYQYISSTNTIIPYFDGTNYRIYDVKLALGCSQCVEGNGYDYLYERHVSADGGPDTNVASIVAQSFIQCFDKYGIITCTQNIFSELENATQTGTATTRIWDSDYDSHYSSFYHNKEENSLIRSTRIDTAGYILANTEDHVLLRVKVKDRDYEDNTTNIEMIKGLNYAISFSLRRKHGVKLWAGGGVHVDELKLEGYTIYIR